jgi:hypothetical protein
VYEIQQNEKNKFTKPEDKSGNNLESGQQCIEADRSIYFASSSPNSTPISPNTNDCLIHLVIYQPFKVEDEAAYVVGSSPKIEM